MCHHTWLPLLAFTYKILLELSSTISSCVVFGCGPATTLKLSGCDRACVAVKVENIYYLALHRKNKKAPGPCARIWIRLCQWPSPDRGICRQGCRTDELQSQNGHSGGQCFLRAELQRQCQLLWATLAERSRVFLANWTQTCSSNL